MSGYLILKLLFFDGFLPSQKGQPDLETNSVANTGAMLSDATGNQLEQLQFALSDALSKGEVNKPFIDLFVAKQTDLLAKALRNNDDQTIQLIDDSFEDIIFDKALVLCSEPSPLPFFFKFISSTYVFKILPLKGSTA